MLDVTRGLMIHFLADPNLAVMLGEFNGRASIFPGSPIPEGATSPFVVIQGASSDSSFGIKGTMARDVTTDIGIYSEANGNVLEVDQPAEYLRWKLEGFNQTDEFVRNWETPITEVFGPIQNDQEDLYGRVLSVRFVMLRNRRS